MELLSEEFVNQFIEFIEAGGYQHINKGTRENLADQMEHEKVDMKNLGLGNVPYSRVMERLKRCYGI